MSIQFLIQTLTLPLVDGTPVNDAHLTTPPPLKTPFSSCTRFLHQKPATLSMPNFGDFDTSPVHDKFALSKKGEGGVKI